MKRYIIIFDAVHFALTCAALTIGIISLMR